MQSLFPSLFPAAVVVGVVLLATPAGAQTQPIAPDAVNGLVAWYDARALYEKQRDRAPVAHWPDTSGNGHDLTEEGNGLPSVFRTLQLGDKPAIQIGKHSSFAVANPFTLGDHTIVLVYRANKPTLGLFSAARNDQLGVVVARDGTHHVILAGTRQSRYNASGVTSGYSITVLSRQGARLRAFVDGVDVSGKEHDDTPLEVGRLFHVALSRAAARDAEGLRLADLIFYDRELTDAERNGVTLHLAEKYALELHEAPAVEAEAFDWSIAEPQASLNTSLAEDFNGGGLAVTWDKPERLEAPFRFDPDEPTRLYCDRDTRVHLSVRLGLRSSAPGTGLRVLVLHNEDDYRLNDEAGTAPDPDEPAGTRLVARLDASLDMQAGDWVEIVLSRNGAEGTVKPVPGDSVLLAIAD